MLTDNSREVSSLREVSTFKLNHAPFRLTPHYARCPWQTHSFPGLWFPRTDLWPGRGKRRPHSRQGGRRTRLTGGSRPNLFGVFCDCPSLRQFQRRASGASRVPRRNSIERLQKLGRVWDLPTLPSIDQPWARRELRSVGLDYLTVLRGVSRHGLANAASSVRCHDRETLRAHGVLQVTSQF